MKKNAGQIMTKNVITVSPGDAVEQVARLLLEHQVSGLPVVDAENRVVGIISEGDLVIREKEVKAPAFSEVLGGVIFLESQKRFFEELKKTIALTVGELMSHKVFTVSEETSLEQIATLMTKKEVNRVPVVNADNKLVGIVTRQDIIRQLTED